MTFEHGEYPDGAEDALPPELVREWTGDETYGSKTIPEGWKRSWSSPICERCWVLRRGFVQPGRLAGAAAEQRREGAHCCAFCGRPTWARIWTRADPAAVPYAPLEQRQP